MIAQIVIPSPRADDNLSRVTAPPIRIPGIQVGRWIIGSEKRVWPGIGTPIRIPIKVLTKSIQADSFKVQLKLLLHGASSRLRKTTTATTLTQQIVNMAESNRMTAIANPIAHIHHVSGCSCSCFTTIYFFNEAGVCISTPHSLAGKPLRPQIKPELAARILTTCPRTSIP